MSKLYRAATQCLPRGIEPCTGCGGASYDDECDEYGRCVVCQMEAADEEEGFYRDQEKEKKPKGVSCRNCNDKGYTGGQDVISDPPSACSCPAATDEIIQAIYGVV